MNTYAPGSSLRVALPPWLLARLIVAGGFAVAVLAADELLTERPLPLRQHFLAWDGSWYADIADKGYAALPEEALRFFPLLPLLARAVAVPLLGNMDAALAVIASAAALVLTVLLYRLAVVETGDEALARRAVWLLTLFPAAVVLVLGYAEAPSIALAVATFLALRSRRFTTAAATGYLVGLSRPVGVAIALPAVIEAARGLRDASGTDRVRRLAAVVSPVAGLATYLAWVGARFDDPFLPLRIHERAELRGDWVLPPVRALESLGELVAGDHLGDGLHAPFIAGFAVLLVVLFRRWPSSYAWYALVLVVVGLSGETLGSFERYGLAAFPLFLGFASLVERPAWERPALALSAASLISFTALVLLGVFVP